ncbi:MAG: hypothetical protein ACRCXT_13530 [Paraclostridium sp.]
MIKLNFIENIKSEDMESYVNDNIQAIANAIKTYEFSEENKDIKSLCKNKSFMDALYNNAKENIDAERAFNFISVTYLINDKRKDNTKYKGELVAKYVSLNREYIKQIASIINCTNNFAIDLSIFLHKVYDNENPINISKRILRLTSKFYSIYTIEKTGKPEIVAPITLIAVNNLIKYIFGDKYYDDCIINILLELRDKTVGYDRVQMSIWNMFTNLVLATMENMNDDRLYDLLNSYIGNIKDDYLNNYERRLIFLEHIVLEDYPNISKIVSQLQLENSSIKF